MPDWVAIVILGIVEGITEFLPVSSTGHLLIVEHWLPRQSDLFNIVIQSGAVLAVIPLFRERLTQFIFQWRERETREYLLKVALAFFITGVGGVLLEKFHFKLTDNPLPIAIALLVGGVAFILVERQIKGKPLSANVTWQMAVVVGLGQLLAAGFPGTSRSGATILLALILGLSRSAATEFTFLVGIPTMLAAGGLKIVSAVLKSHGALGENVGMVALGFLVSAVVSFAVVKWLLRYVQTHTFNAFGYYRILLALFVFLLWGTGHLPTVHHGGGFENGRGLPADVQPGSH
jgi:undecaprenyl-diphosphatase